MSTCFDIRRVLKRDKAACGQYVAMLRQDLYASEVDPLPDIRKATAIFAAHAGPHDIGFVLVSQYASPDGESVGDPYWWLENSVVHKDWRRYGVADALEFAGRDFLRNTLRRAKQSAIILRATIDDKRPHQLERNGWERERTTFDVAVQKAAVVYRLPMERL